MTSAEFKSIVWPYIVESFPSIKPKLLREIDDENQRLAIHAKWYREIFSVFTADESKEACDEMLRTGWVAPFALEEYPAMIQATVRRMRAARFDRSYKPVGRFVNGERRYHCRHCRDTGTREVWHPQSHKAARENPDEFIAGTVQPYTCFARCVCSAGDKLASPMINGVPDQHGMARYDEARGMVLVPETIVEKADGTFVKTTPMDARRQLVAILNERDANGPRRQGQIEYADERGFPT